MTDDIPSKIEEQVNKAKNEILRQILPLWNEVREKMKILDERKKTIEKIVEQAIRTFATIKKGDKGEKGDSGYTPKKNKDYFDGKPGKSIKGEPGDTLIAGKDYPTKRQVYQEIAKQVSKIELPSPQDGKTPIKGVDYLTPKDIKKIITTVVKVMDQPLEAVRKQLKEMEVNLSIFKTQSLGGRTLHRGGMTLEIDELVGTGDGSTTGFDLDYTPYDNSSIITLTVGGGLMFLTDDYTRSGKTITFTTAPPSGAKVRATYRRS